ncbi:MAG: hypothetical protein ACO3E1_11540 [Flavobacteriales bacterium]
MNYRNILLPIFILISLSALSQQKSPKDLMVRYIDSVYNERPKEILDEATTYLDSMAISDQCFKVIFNKNHTKFLAFYAVDKKSMSYKSLKLEYGAHFHSFKNAPKPKGKFKAIGYTVAGILQDGKWIFDGEEYIRLAGKDLSSLQEELMFMVLTERGFFKDGKIKENSKFWNSNGFAEEKIENGKKELAILIHSRSAKDKREKLKVNFKLEKVAQVKTDSLWAKLNAKDSSHYNTRFQDNEEEDIYYVLYNSNRSRVLIPFIYKDNKKQMYLSYCTYTPGDTTNSLYLWKTYPERKIEKIQDQKMDVVKDIRKLSINWLWNTQNFINDEEFWQKNFGSSQLELVE